ncbi:MAG: tRNA (adenosine(37)-N6)-dimethylallyltransferase MiaA [Acidimicrobiaceae bacterium]|nr:tRNA (adenosine(37)-N6)-dimethylallyltransferase MiaA [Acidimicrobiaceae bacterium]
MIGPTASGKSALALELARQFADVELLSGDSMQVYRGMDIGTAKPTPEERAEVPHHLLDLADPTDLADEWNVVRWRAAADEAIAAIEARGHRALLVGGTGLYVQALVDRLDIPGQWPELRAELEANGDTAALHRYLTALDPVAAARVVAGNRRRIVRALEVTLGSGRPFSSFGPGLGAFPKTSWRLLGLWLPRPVVAARITTRLQAMLDAGFVEEVRRLAAAGMSRTARQALGYRELLAHVEHGAPLDACVEDAGRRTRAFARRQRVWWRRDPRVQWFGAAEDPMTVLPALLAAW